MIGQPNLASLTREFIDHVVSNRHLDLLGNYLARRPLLHVAGDGIAGQCTTDRSRCCGDRASRAAPDLISQNAPCDATEEGAGDAGATGRRAAVAHFALTRLGLIGRSGRHHRHGESWH